MASSFAGGYHVHHVDGRVTGPTDLPGAMAAVRTVPAPAQADRVTTVLGAPRLPTGVDPSREPKAPPVSPVRRPSPFEQAARERKVAYLVLAADDLARHSGVTLAQLIPAIERWSDEEWRKLAVAAGQLPPSATSRAEVLTRLRARAAQPTVVPPAEVTRYVVMRKPDSRYAWKHELGTFDTKAEADVVASRQREETSGSGFAQEVWVEPRAVRS